MPPSFQFRLGGQRPRTLYQRLYLHALSVCALTLLISFAAVTFGRHGEWRQTFNRFARLAGQFAAEQLAPHLGDAAATQRTLAELAERFDANIALLDLAGKSVGSVGLPLPPPNAADLAGARAEGFFNPHRGEHWSLVALEQAGAPIGYLEVAPAHLPEAQAALRLASTFLAILGLVAVLIVPFTRSLTKPLASLTESARRFGAGDFEHRVPVRGPREVAALGQEMNDMAGRLSALLHTQRQLLADVSHELRSPLTRIEVALELARAQAPALDGVDGPLHAIQADLDELGQLIRDILATSRLELRPELVELSPCSARALLTEASDRARAAGLPATQLTLIQADPELQVRADRALVAHALGNLLDNAYKHTPPGTQIELGVRPEENRLLFYVADRGPGIPAGELPRLFEPFYRADPARARSQGGGAGLGLSLVRRIAELHGAPPFVQSSPGSGSAFGLSLERA